MNSIATILRILQAGDSGAIDALPLPLGLYSVACAETAFSAFSEFMVGRVTKDGADASLSLEIHAHHRDQAPRIVGEFLNYLLVLSIQQRSHGLT